MLLRPTSSSRSGTLFPYTTLVRSVAVGGERAVLSGVAFAAAILKRGRGLIWFPEGSRSTDGRLQRFKPGIGVLLDRFRVPVVPVVIEGAHEAWPPRATLDRKSTRLNSSHSCAPRMPSSA